jgi:SAM-dependent methyltransferase
MVAMSHRGSFVSGVASIVLPVKGAPETSPADFLRLFEERKPVFAKEVRRTSEAHPDLFVEFAAPMLRWARAALGEGFAEQLIEGYCTFVVDVNRSQSHYERTGHYRYSNYREVHDATYGSAEFMRLYHWGVFTTTFAWQHHLALCEFFRDAFVRRLQASGGPGALVDLGCGSGVWHFLALESLPTWSAAGVDISETSVTATRRMAREVMPNRATTYQRADAITWEPERGFDAGISCFLLEHLEDPAGLLRNLCRCLKPGGLAFVTCALTAAEIDHIFEFRRESEPVSMAEEAGFRVVETFSSAPSHVLPGRRFLPRSMGLLLQRRQTDSW